MTQGLFFVSRRTPRRCRTHGPRPAITPRPPPRSQPRPAITPRRRRAHMPGRRSPRAAAALTASASDYRAAATLTPPTAITVPRPPPRSHTPASDYPAPPPPHSQPQPAISVLRCRHAHTPDRRLPRAAATLTSPWADQERNRKNYTKW